jgi:hypothetical protein
MTVRKMWHWFWGGVAIAVVNTALCVANLVWGKWAHAAVSAAVAAVCAHGAAEWLPVIRLAREIERLERGAGRG